MGRALVVLVGLWVWAAGGVALAQPAVTAVSGEATHGGTLNVTGTGFGAKSPGE